MKIEIKHRCDDFNSYRAARVKSLFNAEPVLKSQKLRKYYKSEINHNSLYINK